MSTVPEGRRCWFNKKATFQFSKTFSSYTLRLNRRWDSTSCLQLRRQQCVYRRTVYLPFASGIDRHRLEYWSVAGQVSGPSNVCRWFQSFFLEFRRSGQVIIGWLDNMTGALANCIACANRSGSSPAMNALRHFSLVKKLSSGQSPAILLTSPLEVASKSLRTLRPAKMSVNEARTTCLQSSMMFEGSRLCPMDAEAPNAFLKSQCLWTLETQNVRNALHGSGKSFSVFAAHNQARAMRTFKVIF